MTMSKKFSYWMSNDTWYGFDIEKGKFFLTEKAPEEARESFELWKKKYNE